MMQANKVLNYIKDVLENMPKDWTALTTHRLDIYNEKLAKTQFLNEFEALFNENNSDTSALQELHTAYDYIRLGHPLSCILEWLIAKSNQLDPTNVISFSSKTIPILAILRENLLQKRNTRIIYTGALSDAFDAELLRRVYGYKFELNKIDGEDDITQFDGTTVYLSHQDENETIGLNSNIDFFISLHDHLGSILIANGSNSTSYIPAIQHVRRRETIAMTPANCLDFLKILLGLPIKDQQIDNLKNKTLVLESIKKITGTDTKALVASSGLSTQYAIMMGLVDYALENHSGKAIKIIVPPNCYGGTNDQARRVAECIENVSVVDLPVDGGSDMVEGIDQVLEQVAKENAVPYIIAEIPTNPRVEVPDLEKLNAALSKPRKTASGEIAVDPVFILDQTFCPNVHFLDNDGVFSSVSTIAYISGSKFPSGGQCTAGFCIGNKKAEHLIVKLERHLLLCDNEATDLQYEILARQMPSMNQRIADAYKNTRTFVNFINTTLPSAKINFVSEELAQQGFTPSVFSLDLPTKGNSAEEKETYKRALNHKLIKMMISEIPEESKHCVSYGQLKGCYWTIPATSTQGTTKEGDKDYIARVALAPNIDLERHLKVFQDFVNEI